MSEIVLENLQEAFMLDNNGKLDAIYELCDVLESYEYKSDNMEDLNKILDFLLGHLESESDNQLVEQMTEAIVLAFIYQKVTTFDYSKVVKLLENLNGNALANMIEILGYSKQLKYLTVLEQYKTNENKLVKEAALLSIKQIKNDELNL
ncbi:hypothetical protein [Fictibacillus gelatini]|uniref:hypothetical protein n=1 Tax=Fictibacillus gelatini TaxID=225985 RepID=UPI0004213FDD|nr:hypothetical protein [Fictibacillus gelatini]